MDTQLVVATALTGLGIAARADAQEVGLTEVGPLPRAHVLSMPLDEDDARLAFDVVVDGSAGVSLAVQVFEDTLALEIAAALQGFAATLRLTPTTLLAPELALTIGPAGETQATARLAFMLP
jgi:hypothetical protein